MKTITTNNRTLLFVEVPDGAIAELMHVDNTGLFTCLDCMVIFSGNPPEPDHEEWRTLLEVQLPTGNYRFIATTDTIHLVDKIGILGGGVFYSDADWDSYFQSFLDNHSITGRHAIIEVL